MEPKNIIITGSSSGFGFLTVKILADAGHTVFAGMRDVDSRNAEPAAELSAYGEASSGSVEVLELDVTSEESVNSAVGCAIESAGQIDVVIHNAGIGGAGLCEAFTVEEFQKVLDVNLYGVHRVNQAVLPGMRERGAGLLLYVSSLMGRIAIPVAGPYTTSKFALEGLIEAYNIEVGQLGIETAVIEPGGYATDFASRMFSASRVETSASYGPMAEAPAKMWSEFTEILTAEGAPDVNDVPNAIVKIIDMEKGERPFRTVVDTMMGGAGVDKINETCEAVQTALNESMKG